MQTEPLTIEPVAEKDKIEGVLRPTGFRILVRILPPEEAQKRWKEWAKAGLKFDEEARHREWGAQLWGLVEDLGPDAYRDSSKFPSGPYCKPGDAVIIRPYVGTRFMVRGHLYALVNDDTIQGVSEAPEEIERT